MSEERLTKMSEKEGARIGRLNRGQKDGVKKF